MHGEATRQARANECDAQRTVSGRRQAQFRIVAQLADCQSATKQSASKQGQALAIAPVQGECSLGDRKFRDQREMVRADVAGDLASQALPRRTGKHMIDPRPVAPASFF